MFFFTRHKLTFILFNYFLFALGILEICFQQRLSNKIRFQRRRLHRTSVRFELVVGTVCKLGFLLVSLTKSFVVIVSLVSVRSITTNSITARVSERQTPPAVGNWSRREAISHFGYDFGFRLTLRLTNRKKCLSSFLLLFLLLLLCHSARLGHVKMYWVNKTCLRILAFFFLLPQPLPLSHLHLKW